MGLNINHSTGEIEAGTTLNIIDDAYSRELSQLLTVSIPRGYIYGLRLHYSTSSSVIITAGFCRNDNDDGNIVFSSTDTASFDSNGAGGLDTGSKAANTLYHVFVIADSNEVNSPDLLISTSFSSPTMPSGYDRKRRVGSAMLGASSELEVFQMEGNGPTRLYLYNDKSTNSIHRFVTSSTVTTFTTADASDTIPSSARMMIVWVVVSASSVSNQCFFRQVGHSVDSPILRTQFGVSGTNSPTTTLWVPVNSSGQFEYKTANTTGTSFHSVGYVEDLTVG